MPLIPEFCRKTCSNFFASNSGRGEIIKKFTNTRAVYIEGAYKIESLVIRNSYINYWSDLWYDPSGNVIDPRIKNLSLQNNRLSEYVVTEERPRLKYLDLSNNPELNRVYLPLAGSLEIVKLNGLNALTDVSLGKNSNKLRRLEIKDCGGMGRGVLSSFVFSRDSGYVDLTNSAISLSDEDRDVIEFLRLNNYTLVGEVFDQV